MLTSARSRPAARVPSPARCSKCRLVLALRRRGWPPPFSFPRFIPTPGEMIHGIHEALVVLGGFTILSTIIFRQIEKRGRQQCQPAERSSRRVRMNQIGQAPQYRNQCSHLWLGFSLLPWWEQCTDAGVRVIARGTLYRFVENRVAPQAAEDSESSSGCVVWRGRKGHLEKLGRAKVAIPVGQHCFCGTSRFQHQGKRIQAGSRDQLPLPGAPDQMAGHT